VWEWRDRPDFTPPLEQAAYPGGADPEVGGDLDSGEVACIASPDDTVSQIRGVGSHDVGTWFKVHQPITGRSRAVSSIRLSPTDRNALLGHYRRSTDPDVRLRAHILLLLDAGHPWATIGAVLYCSLSTISRWKQRFEADGVAAVLGRPRARRSGAHVWASMVVQWVLTLSPGDFRFARSRWSCEAVAVVLREDYRVRVGRETVRLWLRAAGLVWRRPRPVIRPKDPDREAKLGTLRALLRSLPADETAVFMDEVDVNLNPK